ncbi:hypothetical protein [Amycolatopsis sp. NPDC004625]|uniref:hypothetical protein n=1 Tax=Amycolatopsis sp. NPDC004625 TaxID=3154670 RepID=UPI0033AF5A3C
MFLPAPDLSCSDAYACFGVRAPAVRVAPDGAVLAVGLTRPAAALDLIRMAAPSGLVPTRTDATAFRLRWFAYTHPVRSGDPATRPACPGEDGAFPVVIWRAADQAAARSKVGTRTAADVLAVVA